MQNIIKQVQSKSKYCCWPAMLKTFSTKRVSGTTVLPLYFKTFLYFLEFPYFRSFLTDEYSLTGKLSYLYVSLNISDWSCNFEQSVGLKQGCFLISIMLLQFKNNAKQLRLPIPIELEVWNCQPNKLLSIKCSKSQLRKNNWYSWDQDGILDFMFGLLSSSSESIC